MPKNTLGFSWGLGRGRLGVWMLNFTHVSICVYVVICISRIRKSRQLPEECPGRIFCCSSVWVKLSSLFSNHKTVFLNLSTVDVRARWLLVVQGRPVRCNIINYHRVVTTQDASRHCQCPLEGRTGPGWELLSYRKTNAPKSFCVKRGQCLPLGQISETNWDRLV